MSIVTFIPWKASELNSSARLVELVQLVPPTSWEFLTMLCYFTWYISLLDSTGEWPFKIFIGLLLIILLFNTSLFEHKFFFFKLAFQECC